MVDQDTREKRCRQAPWAKGSLHYPHDYEVQERGASYGLSARNGNDDEGGAQTSSTPMRRDATVRLAEQLKKCHPLFLSAEADDRLRGGQVKPDLASRPLTPENIGRLWPPRTIPKGSSPKVRIQNWSSLTPMPRASCNNTSPNGLPPPNGRFIRTGIVFLDHLGATFTPSRPRNG